MSEKKTKKSSKKAKKEISEEQELANEYLDKKVEFQADKLGTPKTVKYCVQCGERRSLYCFPQDNTKLICNNCKCEFRVIIEK